MGRIPDPMDQNTSLNLNFPVKVSKKVYESFIKYLEDSGYYIRVTVCGYHVEHLIYTSKPTDANDRGKKWAPYAYASRFMGSERMEYFIHFRIPRCLPDEQFTGQIPYHPV